MTTYFRDPYVHVGRTIPYTEWNSIVNSHPWDIALSGQIHKRISATKMFAFTTEPTETT